MAAMRPPRSAFTAAAVALVMLVVDQATKAWAQRSLEPGRAVTVIPGWVWFQLRTNTGAALGLLTGHNLIFLLATLLVIVAVTIVVFRGTIRSGLGVGALGAIAGGATGNLLDRIRLGSVVDFIEVHRWPTDFNLADAAIRIGVLLFLVALILDARGPRRGATRGA